MTRDENGPRKPTARKPAARKSVHPAAPADRQRIAKLMARVGLCSRRDAEAWIVDGRVSVNGEILTSPARDVGPEDTILVDDVLLPQAEKTRLFLFHKPRGLVTSDHDPEGRETVTDFLHENWPDGPRVVTIGRLDINTEGLLLLTNDGGLARVLELPQTGWVRRYRVRAKGETDQAVLDRLHDGVSIEGIDYAGIEAKLDRSQGANCWLTMGLREGKNREIKRVLEHIGLEVNRLIRLSFGPFQLLDLPEGKVEEVKTRVLREQLGESLMAAAGVDLQDENAPAPGDGVGETRVLARGDGPGRERISKPRQDAPRQDPSRQDSFRQDSSRQGSSRQERPRQDSPRPDNARGRPARDSEDKRRARPDHREAEPTTRERPTAGTRKHVSALRADENAARRDGPRKRVERTDTKDRRDRTITVDRLVVSRADARTPSPRPEARARRGAGRFMDREPTRPDIGGREARPARDARPSRTSDARREPGRNRDQGSRDQGSPSSMAKRVRIAKSGGEATGAREPRLSGDRPERPRREERGDRPFSAKPSGGKARSVRPVPERPEREDRLRMPRPDATERPRANGPRGRANVRPPRSEATERPPGRTRTPDAKTDLRVPNEGAKRRVGERDAAERDMRKAGARRSAPSAKRGDDRRERLGGSGTPGRRPPPRAPGKGPRPPTKPKR